MSENPDTGGGTRKERSLAGSSALAAFGGDGIAEGELMGSVLQKEHRPPAVPQNKQSFGRWFADKGWRHVVAWLAIIFALFPLMYIFSASLNPIGTLTGSNQLFSDFSLHNY